MSSPGVPPELDMKDVELNEMDPEKQPMNASSPHAGSPTSLGEKNGVVKVKMEEEEEEAEMAAKFTGLSKEQLLQVAGTPGWVRTRWALLVLFWLGWLGMLAGAIVIIVQAPRCKDLPKQDWWQKGGIYRILQVEGFQDSGSDGTGDLAGECGVWGWRCSGALSASPALLPGWGGDPSSSWPKGSPGLEFLKAPRIFLQSRKVKSRPTRLG